MRVFFGLDPDPSCKRAISSWRDRCLGADGRPVPPGNFHVTLAFVGEIDEGPLERLCGAVDGWAEAAQPGAGSLRLDRVGYWPRPAIFWLGSSAVPESLSALALALQKRSVAAGARRDAHDWVPHVTLFRRCRQPPPAPLETPDIVLDYRHITLFESQSGREGVRYSPLAEWPLGSAAVTPPSSGL